MDSVHLPLWCTLKWPSGQVATWQVANARFAKPSRSAHRGFGIRIRANMTFLEWPLDFALLEARNPCSAP